MGISRNETKFLTIKHSSGFKVCTLYFLPKLHKPVVVGRPICSYNGFIFGNVSIWLHHKLFPILLQQKPHLTDSLSLLKELEQVRIAPNTILFTFDVESLSIPTKEGLHALKNMITNAFDDQMLNLIMTLSALVLEYQFLEFNSTYWRHIRGTSMGSNFFVVYACLFLCFLENLQEQTMQTRRTNLLQKVYR